MGEGFGYHLPPAQYRHIKAVQQRVFAALTNPPPRLTDTLFQFGTYQVTNSTNHINPRVSEQ